MGVFGAGEDFKTRHHLAGDVVLREHTPDSFLDHAVRVAGAHLGGAETLKAVAETAVALIFLLLFLVARELDFSGVRDDNEAAGVDGRIKRGKILGAEFVGDNDGDTAERLALRVDEEPLAIVAGIRSTIALLHLYFPFFLRICALYPGFCPLCSPKTFFEQGSRFIPPTSRLKIYFTKNRPLNAIARLCLQLRRLFNSRLKGT